MYCTIDYHVWMSSGTNMQEHVPDNTPCSCGAMTFGEYKAACRAKAGVGPDWRAIAESGRAAMTDALNELNSHAILLTRVVEAKKILERALARQIRSQRNEGDPCPPA